MRLAVLVVCALVWRAGAVDAADDDDDAPAEEPVFIGLQTPTVDALNAVRTWYSAKPNVVISDKVEVADYGIMGLGLRAKDPIEPGSVIFEAPMTAAMSAKAAPKTFIGRKLVRTLGSAALLVNLMYERFVVKDATTSDWKLYVDALPSHIGTLVEWTQKEAAELQGEYARSVYKDKRNDARGEFHRIDMNFHQFGNDTPFPYDQLTWENYLWALSILNSRTFDVPLENGGMDRVLIPFVDLVNHNRSAQVTGSFNTTTKVFTVTSREHFTPGDQVFINYNNFTNLELLSHYGYVEENNPHDEVRIVLKMADTVTDRRTRIDMLQENDLREEETIALQLSDDVMPYGVMAYARIAAMLPPDFRCRNVYLACTPRTEMRALVFLTNTFKRMLAVYPTTIEEDEALLKTDIPWRLRTAVIARISEKRILQHGLEMVQRDEVRQSAAQGRTEL